MSASRSEGGAKGEGGWERVVCWKNLCGVGTVLNHYSKQEAGSARQVGVSQGCQWTGILTILARLTSPYDIAYEYSNKKK